MLLSIHIPDERRSSHFVRQSQTAKFHPDPWPTPMRARIRPVPGATAKRVLVRRAQSSLGHVVAVLDPSTAHAARLRSAANEKHAKDHPPALQAPTGHSREPTNCGRGGVGNPRPH